MEGGPVDILLVKGLWAYIIGSLTCWSIIIRKLSKHNTADRLTRQLLARLPLWMRRDTFGDRSGVPDNLTVAHAGDCWLSQLLIISNEEQNRDVLQKVEQYAAASHLPLRSVASFASAALTGLLLYVFVLLFPIAVPPATPSPSVAATSSVSLSGTSAQQNVSNTTNQTGGSSQGTKQQASQASSQNPVGAGGNAQNQSPVALSIVVIFLVFSVGLYGALLLICHDLYVMSHLLLEVRLLCGKLGLATECANAVSPQAPMIVKAEDDPVYKEFVRLG